MLEPLRKPFPSERLIAAVQRRRPSSPSPVPDATPAASGSQRVSVSLATAMDRGWLDVLYQPKIALAGGRFVGAEALARVQHPTHGQLSPAAFLLGATSHDLERLTEFVVLRAFEDWAVLAAAGHNIRLSVNAPVAVLAGSRLMRLIREERPSRKDWPGLIVEITEGDAVNDTKLTAEVAVQLRIHNVELSIDDFGMGYSSFARLKHFAFREIKLDRSYVRNCATDAINSSICKSVIELAHASGAIAVAEGVARADECEALLDMGCDLAQGYFFGRPASVSKVIALNACTPAG